MDEREMLKLYIEKVEKTIVELINERDNLKESLAEDSLLIKRLLRGRERASLEIKNLEKENSNLKESLQLYIDNWNSFSVDGLV